MERAIIKTPGSFEAQSPPIEQTTAKRTVAPGLPWWCFAVAFGAACIPIGALWDISWHSTIGRDSFWTPAHIMIHLGGLIPGFTAGWLALRATFFPDNSPVVRIWNLRAPLGAWVIIWGAMAMLFSAPFDNWWHEAYGLDVEILSPPHTVLAAGMYAVALGALLLVLSWQNRNGTAQGGLLFVFSAGVLLTMSTIILTEKSYPNQQHGNLFYQLACATYPFTLVTCARVAKVRWGATGAALVYMALSCLMVWILPLFRAQPMLAPIYNPVDRMVPPNFPLLLVVPAVAIDVVLLGFRNRRGFWWDTFVAVLCGTVFFVIVFGVQYRFAEFMISPAADNWFFAGNQHWPYFIKLTGFETRFWNPGKDPITAGGMLLALGLAIFKSRLALWVGNWMRKVQR